MSSVELGLAIIATVDLYLKWVQVTGSLLRIMVLRYDCRKLILDFILNSMEWFEQKTAKHRSPYPMALSLGHPKATIILKAFEVTSSLKQGISK